MTPLSLLYALFCLLTACYANESFYDFDVLSSNGELVSLSQYRGKVTLVTNVASYCGFTDNHYKDYVKLQNELGDRIKILAFPCNQFGAQEPEDVGTIITNMKNKYSVNFEIFDKVDVTGGNVPEAWKFLIAEAKTEPQWNFYKYLVNAQGQVWGAWGPRVDVAHIKPFIKDALRQADNNRQRNEL